MFKKFIYIFLFIYFICTCCCEVVSWSVMQ